MYRSSVAGLLKQKWILFLVSILCFPLDSFSGDWPMWRYDEGRSAASPENLPENLTLIWSRTYTQREMVWDDPLNHDLMPYDRVFEPVVSGKTMILGFNDSDKIVALDIETGNEKWVFFTDGPVRMPPVIWEGRVLATSDDGFLYCIKLNNGALAWKLRGGPNDTRVLGNKRLISMWPARGGAVVRNGIVYFAAGIWPFMGIFIYAVDIKSGNIVWENSGTGSTYMLQPHNAPSFGGVAPQGSLAIVGDRLIIPGGRSVPACFDLKTGKFLYYNLAAYGKTGGSFVTASNGIFFNHSRDRITDLYDAETGTQIARNVGIYPVLDKGVWYFPADKITGVRCDPLLKNVALWKSDSTYKKTAWPDLASKVIKDNILWETNVDSSGDLIKSGDCLYAASGGNISAVRTVSGNSPQTIWRKTVRGTVERLVTADGKLFAVTLEGTVLAFGKPGSKPVNNHYAAVASEPGSEDTQRAIEIIESTGIREGYAVLYGAGEGLVEAIAANSDLKIIAVEKDTKKVAEMRVTFDRKGIYGKRIAVHQGETGNFACPKYIASLTVVLDPPSGQSADKIITGLLDSARPYGGAVLFRAKQGEMGQIRQIAGASGNEGIQVTEKHEYIECVRNGALPGAGEWTHNYASIANTTKSSDSAVRLPLGLLWFGGNSNMDVLPRHGHGPSEQVSNGRLFIQGVNCLSARDVYTGRILWKRDLFDLNTYGVYYDETYSINPTSTARNQAHIPGANIRGANMTVTPDRVYIIQGGECLVLDASTGKTLKVFSIVGTSSKGGEDAPAAVGAPRWGYIGVYKNFLLGGRDFVSFAENAGQKRAEINPTQNTDYSASKSLVAMDRITGEKFWEIESRYGFIHNGICAGGGMIFCIDRMPPSIEDFLSRRGKTPGKDYSILAIDIATGKVVWKSETDVFGTFLSYSEKHDLLVLSTRPSRDMVSGESGNKLRVFRAKDGSVVWEKNQRYATFPILHNDLIITESGAVMIETGEQVKRTSPITGVESVWDWRRYYGCNYPIASEYLLTFRSGAAGYFDLGGDSGTGNFGGFKSGCTANLVAADGVLNAPDYTRTCSCSYQNQTSLALVHMPGSDIENWTFNTEKWDGKPVKRIGINFGAPGDCMSPEGTLWLDYPSVGGDSPDLPIEISGKPEWYRYHSSKISSGNLKWVSASGAKGIEKFIITISKENTTARLYTVRLFFSEIENKKAGERVFDIAIQGKQVLTNFDIIGEAGGKLKEAVREFKGIPGSNTLTVELTGKTGKDSPVISGIEIIQE